MGAGGSWDSAGKMMVLTVDAQGNGSQERVPLLSLHVWQVQWQRGVGAIPTPIFPQEQPQGNESPIRDTEVYGEMSRCA